MEKKSNNVHFYVARDLDNTLWVYLGKPTRGDVNFCIDNNSTLVDWTNDLEKWGLNKADFKYLKWEDEPVEVFLNMED